MDDRCRFFSFDFFSTSSAFSIFPKKIIGPDLDNKFRISFELQKKVPEDTFFRLHVISCLKMKDNNIEASALF